MQISYTSIYSRFLAKVKDYEFAALPQDDVYEMMRSWLHSTLSRPYLRRVFSSITLDDETLTLTAEMKTVVDDDADQDFVEEAAAMGMVIEWLEPRVKSSINISQMFGGKEQSWFSQAQHMAQIKEMLSDAKTELRKMIRDRGYIYNSYVKED